MSIISGQKSVGLKRVSIAANNTSGSAIFSGIEFNAATGYPTLEGPLSLVIDVSNLGFLSPLYVGVTIETIERSFNLGDRVHIAFVPFNKRITLSASSFPQLGSITGSITKITINFDIFPNTTQPTLIDVALRLGAATLPATVPPYIGSDSRVFSPGRFDGVQGTVAVPIGGAASVITDTSLIVIPYPTPLRYRLRLAYMAINPAAAVDTARVFLQFIDAFGAGFNLARLANQTVQQAFMTYDQPIEFDTSAILRILATNNSAAPVSVYGNIFVEVIY